MGTFQALAESEVGIPANEIILLHNMRPLVGDKRPLSEQGVSEGDILLVNRGGTSQAAPEPESMDLGSGKFCVVPSASFYVSQFSYHLRFTEWSSLN